MPDQTITLGLTLESTDAQRRAQELAGGLDHVKTSTQGAGSELDRFAASFGRLGDAAVRLNALGDAARGAFDTARQLAEGLASNASEAQRLSVASRALGLDYAAAAQGAGGYVDSLAVLNASQALTQRGIRLSQTELDAFARTAQDYARTTGREFNATAEQLAEAVAKGGEEAGRFGPRMASLAAPTATAQERLAALVQSAREVPPAAQTAAESLRELEGAATEATRAFSEGFAQGVADLRAAEGQTTSARDAMRELKDEVYAIGAATATVFGTMANAVRLVASEVSGFVGDMGAAVTAVRELGSNPTEARAILERYEATRRSNEASTMAAFDRLMAGLTGSERTSEGSVSSTAFGRAAERTQRAGALVEDTGIAEPRRIRGGGGGSGRAANDNAAPKNATALLMDQALRDSDPNALARQLGLDGRPELLQEGDPTEALFTRRGAGGAPGDRIDQANRDRATTRERRAMDDRLSAMSTFTDRWEELHHRQINAQTEAADALSGALESTGKALTKHFEAVRTGRETVGDAMRGILADTLDAIGTEALVKGGFYAAEAIAKLVMYDFPGAATAAAASAAYFAVGAGAKGLGSAIAPAAPQGASSGSQGSSSPSRPAGVGSGSGNTASNGDTNITINLGGGGVVMGTSRQLGEALGRAINGANNGVSINTSRLRSAA